MNKDVEIPNLKKNQYIFAGVGAVLGGLIGAGVAGAATAVLGIVVGGVIGHQLLTRVGK
jgi:osmotically inducible lipoprotein OsmB